MKKQYSYIMIYSILLGFFVMGFVDLVGIATNYIKSDFLLLDKQANLMPMMVFLWFAVFSIPAGIIMGKVGKKNTVLISIILTAFALFFPLFYYNFTSLLFSFALLGIGNTILQVSLNPMAAQIVSKERIASVLTLGQFVKALSSFLGPIIVSATAFYFGNWKLVFIIYGIVTLLAGVVILLFVQSDKPHQRYNPSSCSILSLFVDKKTMQLFAGIMAIVAIDVGLNTYIPQILMEQANLPLNEAGLGVSVYFISRTVGTFLGAFLLTRIAGNLFMRICMIISILSFSLFPFGRDPFFLLALIVVIGFTCSNVFSIIFSYALQSKPKQTNEVSALMIMGVSGGALVMPFMGILSDWGGQIIGLLPLLFCMLYLLWISKKL